MQSGLLASILVAFAAIGRLILALLAMVGRVTRFAVTTVLRALTPPYYPAQFIAQLLAIGWYSLPVVGLTAIFTGSALAQQIYTGGSRFDAESTVPAVVVFGIVRELGPVLVGLMVAGRVSSAMAAELGTMCVTEQLDAMATLRTDRFRYLIAPRLFAATLALPLMVLVANAIGIMGGYLLAIYKLDFNAGSYLDTTRKYLEAQDIIMSVVKAATFGFIIALMGCYNGLRTGGGAAGVGRATTDAVVSAFILILFTDLLITLAAFGG
ncbi:MlaE family ABC transporter permease [Sphingomonas morindae]|uniref:ABC transporter permease n=1 Tax=Sphingomonas morindae TaxID=1541170 RepID=A0ABY4XAN4_9SPHN|nr:ABC transporter permease [Sphingomonas morindae]USI74026.1 ABC transporter permease [Sphingomonas morindae]